MRKIRALHKQVFVQRAPEAELTKSGLWLPSSARERPQIGTAVAVASDSDLRPGSSVLFPKFSDRQYLIDGVAVEIIPETNVIIEITEVKNEASTEKQGNQLFPKPDNRGQSRAGNHRK